jgi:hypothetical protein
MLIDVLIDVGAAVPDSLFGRLMRSLDRSLLAMSELDERSRLAATAQMSCQEAARSRRWPSRSVNLATSPPSMMAGREAMTTASAI